MCERTIISIFRNLPASLYTVLILVPFSELLKRWSGVWLVCLPFDCRAYKNSEAWNKDVSCSCFCCFFFFFFFPPGFTLFAYFYFTLQLYPSPLLLSFRWCIDFFRLPHSSLLPHNDSTVHILFIYYVLYILLFLLYLMHVRILLFYNI